MSSKRTALRETPTIPVPTVEILSGLLVRVIPNVLPFRNPAVLWGKPLRRKNCIVNWIRGSLCRFLRLVTRRREKST